MHLVLLPYKASSKGAQLMASELHLSAIPRDANPRFEGRPAVLNWGRGDYPVWNNHVGVWINHPRAVMNAIDKGTSYEILRRAGVPSAPFTRDIDEARRWVRDGGIVLCRTELQGRDGSGIIVARREAELVPAPIYTKYIKKVNEYRVHVMNGEVFYANERGKKRVMPQNAEPLVRSGKQGWLFLHMDNLPSKAVCDASVSATKALGLDFAGVDVGESADGTVTVYEVNTAPELGPNTVAKYAAAFKHHYGQYNNNENVPIGTV